MLPPRGRLDNQVTVVARMDLATLPAPMVNVKVFRNGRVQLTGVKSIAQGRQIRVQRMGMPILAR